MPFSTYVQLFRIKGIPVRMSWLMPLGALMFSGFRLDVGVLLAYPVVVLVHELGHAFFARRRRLRVHGVDIDALGGQCRFGGQVSAYDLQIVAWGGVTAQALLALTALLVFAYAPHFQLSGGLERGLVERNLFMAVFNLLPFAPLDGHQAWQLPRTLYRRYQSRKARRAKKPAPPRLDPYAVSDTITDALERAREDARAQRKLRDKT